MTFPDLLKRAGLTKAELARRLGLSQRTVSSWRDSPPRYAEAYLRLLRERNLYREMLLAAGVNKGILELDDRSPWADENKS